MKSCTFCITKNGTTKESDKELWIACDACKEWFHALCVGLNGQEEVEQIGYFYCPNCIATHGPITYKQRKSNRSQTRLNYADLNEGTASGDERIWGRLLSAKSFKKDNFKRYKGSQVNMELLRTTGLREPFVIEENDPELDMKMPPNDITVYDIAELVGGDDYPVEVIDVASQSEVPGWTMGRWASYFHSTNRDRIRNVISLEISGSELAEQVTRPKIVRELDWIDLMWPAELHPQEFPRVQLYCLMGTKDSYTDFHIDFGGSSVFYHILSGAKTFYFIEPTSKNLKKYQKWTSSPEQSTTFLGDEVKECYSVELKSGNTMIIPAGWIHAVYTPEDAIVIGGNFLSSFNIGAQMKVYEIEKATDVPLKFRFPFYMRLNWYALSKFEAWLSEGPEVRKKFSFFELESMAVLAATLRNELVSDRSDVTSNALSSGERKSRQIPEIITDPIGLTKRVLELVRATVAGADNDNTPLKIKPTSPPKPKVVFQAKTPLVNESDEDEDFLEEEEDEEDFRIDEEDEDEVDVEDDEYEVDQDEEDTIPVIKSNMKTEKKPSKKKKVDKKVIHKPDDSSSDDDSMGTSKGKSMNKTSSLFSNRKRSLSNNSAQKSTKQRLLDRISNSKRY